MPQKQQLRIQLYFPTRSLPISVMLLEKGTAVGAGKLFAKQGLAETFSLKNKEEGEVLLYHLFHNKKCRSTKMSWVYFASRQEKEI